VAGQRLGWADKDVFCMPSWTFHEHVNAGDRPAIPFSHTDVLVMRSLDLHREEAHPAGWQ
jgi:gentisate 1,2-dioxygenase